MATKTTHVSHAAMLAKVNRQLSLVDLELLELKRGDKSIPTTGRYIVMDLFAHPPTEYGRYRLICINALCGDGLNLQDFARRIGVLTKGGRLAKTVPAARGLRPLKARQRNKPWLIT
jgi:hypothetical protein